MTDFAELKSQYLIQVHLGAEIFDLECEPYRSKPDRVGFGIYLNKSLKKYGNISDEKMSSIKQLAEACAHNKNADFRFE